MLIACNWYANNRALNPMGPKSLSKTGNSSANRVRLRHGRTPIALSKLTELVKLTMTLALVMIQPLSTQLCSPTKHG